MKPQPLDIESLWSALDVAKYLKASRSWVYGKAEAGILPSIRLGGLLRFDPDVVRRWASAEASHPHSTQLATVVQLAE